MSKEQEDHAALELLAEAGGSLHERDIRSSVRTRLIMTGRAEVRMPFLVSITPAGRAALAKSQEQGRE